MHQNRKLQKMGVIAHFALVPVDLPQTLCMCPCVHVCVCVWVWVCACVYVCVRIIVHACTYIYMYTQTHTHTHISSHPRTQTCLTCLSRILSLLPKKEMEIPKNTKTNTPRYNVCNRPHTPIVRNSHLFPRSLSHSLSFNLLSITIRATP